MKKSNTYNLRNNSNKVFKKSTLSQAMVYAIVALSATYASQALAQNQLAKQNSQNANQAYQNLQNILNKKSGQDWSALKNEQYKLLEQGRQVVKPWEHEWQFGLNYWFGGSFANKGEKYKSYASGFHTPVIKSSPIKLSKLPEIDVSLDYDPKVSNRLLNRDELDLDKNAIMGSLVFSKATGALPPTELPDVRLNPNVIFPSFTIVTPKAENPVVPSPAPHVYLAFSDCNYCPYNQLSAKFSKGSRYTDPDYYLIHHTWSDSSNQSENLFFKAAYLDGGAPSEPDDLENKMLGGTATKLININSFNEEATTFNNGQTLGRADWEESGPPNGSNIPKVYKKRNNQYFFVGGSRGYEYDNSIGGNFIEGHELSLAGPLVFGITKQDAGSYPNTAINYGSITDKYEKDKDYVINMPVDSEGYLLNTIKYKDDQGNIVEEDVLGKVGGPNEGKSVLIGPRLPSTVNSWSNYDESQNFYEYRIRKSSDGYLGYKIAIAKIEEYSQVHGEMHNYGSVDLRGENSVGLFAYIPTYVFYNNTYLINQAGMGLLPSNNTKEYRGEILISGHDSYAMKWSAEENSGSTKYSAFENKGSIVLRRNPDGVDKANHSIGMGINVDPAMEKNKFVSLNYNTAKNSPTGVIRLQDNIEGSVGVFVDIGTNFANQGIVEIETQPDTHGDGTEPLYNIALYAKQVSAANKGFLNASYNREFEGRLYETSVVNDFSGKIKLQGSYSIGMMAEGSETGFFTAADQTRNASAINRGEIINTPFDGKNILGMVAKDGGQIYNSGKINLSLSNASQGPLVGMIVLPESSGVLQGETVVNGMRTIALHNEGTFEMKAPDAGVTAPALPANNLTLSPSTTNIDIPTKALIKASGSESIAIYAKGENTVTTLRAGNVEVTDGGMGVYSDSSTIHLTPSSEGSLVLTATGENTLLFVNTNRPGTVDEPTGIYDLANQNPTATNYNTIAKVSDGAYAFFLKSAKVVKGRVIGIDRYMDKMLINSKNDGSKLELNLGVRGNAFALYKPQGGEIYLSSIPDPLTETPNFGRNLLIKTPSGETRYTFYSIYRGSFLYDQDVNLDMDGSDASSLPLDDIYKINIVSTSQALKKGFTIDGTKPGQTGLVGVNFVEEIENIKEIGTLDDIKIINRGNIHLTGDSEPAKSTMGMAGIFVTLNNEGTIEVLGKRNLGIYSASGSAVTNSGSIILDKNSGGIIAQSRYKDPRYAGLGDGGIDITHTGTISTKTNATQPENFIGIIAKYNDIPENQGAKHKRVINKGTIDFSKASKSIAVYLENLNYTADTNTKINVGKSSIGVQLLDSNAQDDGSTITFFADGAAAYQFSKDKDNNNFVGRSIVTNPNIVIDAAVGDGINIVYSIDGADLNQATKADLDIASITSNSPKAGLNLINLTKKAKYTFAKPLSAPLQNLNESVVLLLREGSEVKLATDVQLEGNNSMVAYVTGSDSRIITENPVNLTLTGNNNMGMFFHHVKKDALPNDIIDLKANVTIKGGESGIGLFRREANYEADASFISRGNLVMESKGTKALGARNVGTLEQHGEISLKADETIGILPLEVGTLSMNKKILMGTFVNRISDSIGVQSLNLYNLNIAAGSGIEGYGDGLIGLVSYIDPQADQDIVWNNAGKISLEGENNAAVHLTGAAEGSVNNHTGVFTNTGEISIGDLPDNAQHPSVAIYSDRKYYTINNNGLLKAGKNVVGIVGHDINSNNASELNIGTKGTGIIATGNLNLEGKLVLSEGEDTISKQTVGVLHRGIGTSVTLNHSPITQADYSIPYVISGSNNTVTVNTPSSQLSHGSIFLYSDSPDSSIVAKTNITTTAQAFDGPNSKGRNIGFFVAGDLKSSGNIDMSNSYWNIAILSRGELNNTKSAINEGTIKPGLSYVTRVEGERSLYSIGMFALGGATHTGHVVNNGTIEIDAAGSIGLAAAGAGSTAINKGMIKVNQSATGAIGMYAAEGATIENSETGVIELHAKNSIGMYVKGGALLKNYGRIIIKETAEEAADIVNNGGSIASDSKPGEYESSNGSGSKYDVNVEIGSHTERLNIDKLAAGRVVNVAVIPNAMDPDKMVEITDPLEGIETLTQDEIIARLNGYNAPAANFGKPEDLAMYVDTSGKRFTKPIENLVLDPQGEKAMTLVVGTEASVHTNSKVIEVDASIIEPFNQQILSTSPKEVYVKTDALHWAAIANSADAGSKLGKVYLVKLPYDHYVDKGNKHHNLLKGLEDRYSDVELDSKEKQLFNKMNLFRASELGLFMQAVDEISGYQYATQNRRYTETKNLFDREFNQILDWDTSTKHATKLKVFGEYSEFNTDEAGLFSHKRNARGFMLVHQKETVKLGDEAGLFFGYARDNIKFNDMGGSKEDAQSLYFGMHYAKGFGHNRESIFSLRLGGEASMREMERKFVVSGEKFQSTGESQMIGGFVDMNYAWNKRVSPNLLVSPSIGLDLGVRKIYKFSESGDLRLDVNEATYYTLKPKVGFGLEHQTELADGRVVNRLNVTAGYDFAYNRDPMQVRISQAKNDWTNLNKDNKGALDIEILGGTSLEKRHWGFGAFAGIKPTTKQWTVGLEGKIKFW